MNPKAKLLLSFIFFGGMGIICLYFAIDLFITGTGIRGQKFLFDQYDNLFLKYLMAYLFIAFSIPCFGIPLLSYKGILTLDYYDSSKFKKAKTDFIISSLILPTALIFIVLFYLEGCDSGLNCKIALLVGILYFGYFFRSIFILSGNKEIDS
jgi:hypothetical protein